jgi:Domain of unknown function (DUF4184)
MPFTLAHPAAVIPLARLLGGWGVMSALIIGSMTPDIAFLLPIGVSRTQSHGLAGLFWCCLPMGLCCYLAFHGLMKRPMIHLLPPPAFARLGQYDINSWALRWRNLLPVLLSLLIGSFTHIIWDSFTHKGSWAVRNFAWLRIHLFTGGGFWIYLYTALQWISSVIGLGLLAWWTIRWLHRTPVPIDPAREPMQRGKRWTIVLLMAIASLVMGALAVRPYIVPAMIVATQELVSRSMLGAISGFGAALLLYCACWNVWTWHRR